MCIETAAGIRDEIDVGLFQAQWPKGAVSQSASQRVSMHCVAYHEWTGMFCSVVFPADRNENLYESISWDRIHAAWRD